MDMRLPFVKTMRLVESQMGCQKALERPAAKSRVSCKAIILDLPSNRNAPNCRPVAPIRPACRCTEGLAPTRFNAVSVWRGIRTRKEVESSQRFLGVGLGVVYRPRTEVQSHYFHASLPEQFDEWIWFDESHALRPLLPQDTRRHPPPHPFATID
jgi:hypothetical protein